MGGQVSFFVYLRHEKCNCSLFYITSSLNAFRGEYYEFSLETHSSLL